MKTNKLLCILTVVALLGISGCHEENNGTIPGVFSPAPENDTLFQASTLGALMMGVYDGDMSFADLKSHGGFGLGTLNRLDGEMIALEGKFYHVRADGCA
ncbi:MAG: acetolactate decarboxylase, partial [Gemmatimonadota bacterium]|nr:acetolactate decarboxylase [Gemmatimonadota bacterium]